MHYPTLTLLKVSKVLIESVKLLLMVIVSVGCVLRLGNMQLDGLPQLAAVVVGLLFAFTSLTFNRARAFPNGRTQRRALYAADLAFGASLSCVAGICIAAVTYFYFDKQGYKATPPDKFPTQVLPALFSFVPLAFFTHTCFAALTATRILIYERMRLVRTRRWLRENKLPRARGGA